MMIKLMRAARWQPPKSLSSQLLANARLCQIQTKSTGGLMDMTAFKQFSTKRDKKQKEKIESSDEEFAGVDQFFRMKDTQPVEKPLASFEDIEKERIRL